MHLPSHISPECKFCLRPPPPARWAKPNGPEQGLYNLFLPWHTEEKPGVEGPRLVAGGPALRTEVGRTQHSCHWTPIQQGPLTGGRCRALCSKGPGVRGEAVPRRWCSGVSEHPLLQERAVSREGPGSPAPSPQYPPISAQMGPVCTLSGEVEREPGERRQIHVGEKGVRLLVYK